MKICLLTSQATKLEEIAKFHVSEQGFQMDNHRNMHLRGLRIFESMPDNNNHENWIEC